MNDEYDKFNDVICANTGIFEGTDAMCDGLKCFDNPTTTTRPDGVAVGMQCRGCGKPVQITVEYPELIAIKYGCPPQAAFQGQQGVLTAPSEWQYSTSQSAWWPAVPCRRCGTVCAPLFSAEEAEMHLARARRNGWLRQDREMAISNLCAQVAEGFRRA